jgi:uncharacterized protein YpiB (UPF0302 family)
MSNEIKNIVDEIKSNLVLIKTSGNNPIEYYGIKGADIELIERLADERDAHHQYQADVAYRFNTKFKTAQTAQDGSKRVDTLGKGEKLKAAKALVDAMFTAKESAATKQKKAITSGADLVSQIDKAKAAGDKKRESELQEQLNDLMRAFATK